jgi:hypothetical protein
VKAHPTRAAYLLDCCRGRMADRFRGHDETIAQRLERDLAALDEFWPRRIGAIRLLQELPKSERRVAGNKTKVVA